MKKSKKIYKILIPNATNPNNLGDLAITTVLIDLINSSLKNSEIVLHSSEPKNYSPKFSINKITDTIYSYAALSEKNHLVKIWRMSRVLAYLILFATRIHIIDSILIKDKLYKICLDYRKSDLIIFVGGGYFRSRTGLKQSLNLIMQLLHVQFAKLTNAKIIICPISFGPFAHPWQQKISGIILKNINLIAAREKISYKLLLKEKVSNVILSPDHALLLKKISGQKKHDGKIYLGITIRRWLNDKDQVAFEKNVVNAIKNLTINKKLVIVPIAQVVNKKYGDNDDLLVRRLCDRISSSKIEIAPLVKIKDINHAVKVYSRLDVLLGMRMHSNIIAATQGIPFLNIAYEHKSIGLSKILSLSDYCISVESVTEDNVRKSLTKLIANRKRISALLSAKIDQIKKTENTRWVSIFNKI